MLKLKQWTKAKKLDTNAKDIRDVYNHAKFSLTLKTE